LGGGRVRIRGGLHRHLGNHEMRDIRHVARQRWREVHRKRTMRDAAQRFVSAFFFGVVLATLAAIVIGSFKQ
jgi:hypothetical protein